MAGTPKNLHMNVNLSDTRPVACECGCPIFLDAKHLRYLSGLQSPDGNPQILEVPIKVCMSCSKAYTLADMLKGISNTDAAKASGIIMEQKN